MTRRIFLGRTPRRETNLPITRTGEQARPSPLWNRAEVGELCAIANMGEDALPLRTYLGFCGDRIAVICTVMCYGTCLTVV